MFSIFTLNRFCSISFCIDVRSCHSAVFLQPNFHPLAVSRASTKALNDVTEKCTKLVGDVLNVWFLRLEIESTLQAARQSMAWNNDAGLCHPTAKPMPVILSMASTAKFGKV